MRQPPRMESGRLLNTLSVRPEGILTKLSLLEKSSRLHGAGNVIAELIQASVTMPACVLTVLIEVRRSAVLVFVRIQISDKTFNLIRCENGA